jgi:indolepyruvate ferredoxin oxidoreductase
MPPPDIRGIETLDELIQRRVDFLCDYQDEALADKYVALVNKVRSAEEAIVPGASTALTDAVARSYFKTLAYKDEYEVARLYTDTGFLKRIRKEYGKNASVHFNLAPPVLARGVDARGRPRKREFGAWVIPVFRLLAKMRKLRGTRFDLFGMTAERKMEREMIVEFESQCDQLLQSLTAGNVNIAIDIIKEYLEIRGYGPVKEAAAKDARTRIQALMQDYMNIDAKAA